RFDEMVPKEAKPARSVDDIVSPALALLVECIRRVRYEPKTCFVAMPFREPFENYYHEYYRPLLAPAGYPTIRPCRPFGHDDSSPLLVGLLHPSGAFFGDTTLDDESPQAAAERSNAGRAPSGLNVAWELGVAQGAGKTVFLVRDERSPVAADLSKNSGIT